jgi:hypothetical protein
MTAPDWREMAPGEFDLGAHGEMALPIPAAELAAVMPGDDVGTEALPLWPA